MKIAVIADDLTGANADGALLTAKGFQSATCLSLAAWSPEFFKDYAAVAMSADSRLLRQQEAYEAVYAAVSTLAAESPIVTAKRIDSTLRGNVGAEIEAALAALDVVFAQKNGATQPPHVAVVVPSYPSSGRIAVGGYLIVHGVPLECSPIAKDSATPLFDTAVVKIIRRQTDLPMATVPLETVLAGADAVRAAVEATVAKGSRIVVCDAVTDDDIAVIAAALGEVPFPVLAVDPGPFTAEFAAVKIKSLRDEFENRIFCAIGSTTQLTRMQMEYLHVTHPCYFCAVNVPALLASPQERAAEVARVLQELQHAPLEAAVLGVCTAAKAEDVFSLESMAEKLGKTPSQISQDITSGLSTIVREALATPSLRIGGLYTSGGEVTVTAIEHLSAKGFSVRDEVLPLAVYGRVIHGDFPDLPMVTKGGFVGDKESLVHCVDYLFTKISTKKRKGQV